MKRMMGLCLVAFLVLAGCGDGNRLTEGAVIAKEYDDDDSYYQPPVVHPGRYVPGTRSCSGGYGTQPQTCIETPGRYEPGYTSPGYWVEVPARWLIKIKGKDGDKIRTETHEVGQRDYDCIRVGDYWRHDDDPCAPR